MPALAWLQLAAAAVLWVLAAEAAQLQQSIPGEVKLPRCMYLDGLCTVSPEVLFARMHTKRHPIARVYAKMASALLLCSGANSKPACGAWPSDLCAWDERLQQCYPTHSAIARRLTPDLVACPGTQAYDVAKCLYRTQAGRAACIRPLDGCMWRHFERGRPPQCISTRLATASWKSVRSIVKALGFKVWPAPQQAVQHGCASGALLDIMRVHCDRHYVRTDCINAGICSWRWHGTRAREYGCVLDEEKLYRLTLPAGMGKALLADIVACRRSGAELLQTSAASAQHLNATETMRQPHDAAVAGSAAGAPEQAAAEAAAACRAVALPGGAARTVAPPSPQQVAAVFNGVGEPTVFPMNSAFQPPESRRNASERRAVECSVAWRTAAGAGGWGEGRRLKIALVTMSTGRRPGPPAAGAADASSAHPAASLASGGSSGAAGATGSLTAGAGAGAAAAAGDPPAGPRASGNARAAFFEQLQDITGPNKEAYARLHGYDYHDDSSLLDASRPASWSKLRCVLAHLRSYDWVMWVDADTLITDMATPLEAFLPHSAAVAEGQQQQQLDFILTRDPGGYNAGVWLVRNSSWAWALLERWWGSRGFERDMGDTKSGDNDALKWLLATMPKEELAAHVGVAPQCAFNSYVWRPSFLNWLRYVREPLPLTQGLWRPGDFLVHTAGVDDKASALGRVGQQLAAKQQELLPR